MKNIYAAFVKAQAGFAPALKTSTNPHFKSKYADLSACVEAVIDSLHKHGIGLIQRAHEDAIGVTVETVLVHESGEMIECGKLHVPAAKQDPQGYGSAMTYARRYSLMAACGIAPEDDDGNAAARRPEGSLAPALVASIEQVEKVKTGALAAAAEEAGRGLDGATKTALAKLAAEVGALFTRDNGAELAYTRIEIDELNGDEKTYLWGMFDSKIRSALKREGQTRALMHKADEAEPFQAEPFPSHKFQQQPQRGAKETA